MAEKRPNLFQRMKLATRVLGGGLPTQYPIERKKKAFPFVWPLWREGKAQWHLTDFETYVDSGFNINSLIYQAITYKARSLAVAKLRVYLGSEEDPILAPPDHPIAQLIKRPNEFQSWVEFQQLCDVFLNISGNSYVLLSRTRGTETPTAMWPLRPDRVFIIPKAGKKVLGYWYVPEGKPMDGGYPILPSDLMHIKLPNPGDPLEGLGYGLSPMSPIAQSATVDNMVTEFLNKFFDSGTLIHTYVTFEEPMEQEALAESKEKFMELYGGYKNWAEPAFLDTGGKIQRFGMDFEEMGFGVIDERSETRILGPLGVPLTLLATRSGRDVATYNNKLNDRRMFWEDVLIPEMRLFEAEYQYHMRSSDGAFVKFDISGVPAIARDIPLLVDAWSKLVERGVSLGAAARTVSLQLDDPAVADVRYISAQLVQADENGAPMLPPGPLKSLPPPLPISPKALESKKWSEEQKSTFWKAADLFAVQFEPEFESLAIECFEHDKRAVLAAVREGAKAAIANKATFPWSETKKKAVDALDGKIWKTEYEPAIKHLVGAKGAELSLTFGMAFDVQNLHARDWFNSYMLEFADDINETTKETISEVLNQGQREGWSIGETQNHLEETFEAFMYGADTVEDWEWLAARMPRNRTEQIARTETLRAANAGSLEIYKEFGAEAKEWLATRDSRVRTAHARAGERYQEGGKPGPILLDEFFKVDGDTLRYPGDPNGRASNVINCRCTIVPSMKKIKLPESQTPVERQFEAPRTNPHGIDVSDGNDFIKDNLTARDANIYAERERAKKLTQDRLTKRTGFDRQDVRESVANWAQTSNDSQWKALHAQAMAEKEFGIKMSAWQKRKYLEQLKERETHFKAVQKWRNMAEEIGEDVNQHIWSKGHLSTFEDELTGVLKKKYLDMGFKTADDVQRAFLRAMYDETQEQLAKAGVEYVKLYRGISVNENEFRLIGKHVDAGKDTLIVKSNTMSSWTSQAKTASDFASGSTYGIVNETIMPASRVISTPFSGFGCLNEWEYVVLGGDTSFKTTLARSWQNGRLLWKK